jgi:CDP-diacylglycerol--glycerol-3-phosphate 3-phosphatidyltransferase
MTIPNMISIFRILLVPIFLVFIINNRFLAGLVVFVLAGLSDGADGLVARLFNQKSRLGSYLDPLADKCLLVAAFICLAVMHIVPLWLTALVITRDILILLGSIVLFLINKDHVVKPSIWGKVTTFSAACHRVSGPGRKALSSFCPIRVYRLRSNRNPDHYIGLLVYTVVVLDDERDLQNHRKTPN